MDITIQRGNDLPEFTRCTDCCHHFHCPFCTPKWFLPTTQSKVKAHLKRHFNRAVQHGGYTIHRCCRLCRKVAHYHCPYCKSTVLRTFDFKKHLDWCKGKSPAVEYPSANEANEESMSATPVSEKPSRKKPKPLQKKQKMDMSESSCVKSKKYTVVDWHKSQLSPTTEPDGGEVAAEEGEAAAEGGEAAAEEGEAAAEEGEAAAEEGEAAAEEGEEAAEGGEATAEEGEAAADGANQNMDITIQRGDTLPALRRCTDCCSYFHCPFCTPKWFRPNVKSKTEAHLKIHFNRSVHYAGYTIHRCCRSCRNRPHYHCPYCKSTLLRTMDFMKHLNVCKSKEAPDTTFQSVQPPSASKDGFEPVNTTPVPCKGRQRLEAGTRQLCTAENGEPTQNVDITVQTGDSLPALKKCSDCSYVHCPFCSPIMFRPTKMSKTEQHLKTHFNYSVKFADYTIHRCRRNCRAVPHYHCPYCNSTVLRSMDFMRHLEVCKSKDTSNSAVQSLSESCEPVSASPIYKNMNFTLNQNRRQKCPKCPLIISKKNLKKHINRWHSLLESDISTYFHLKSECVDTQNGIYAVHNIIRGVSRPLHVQIKMQGEIECVACDASLCQSKLELARTELKSYKCKHLQSVSHCRTFLSSPALSQSMLTEMAKRKLFSKSKIKPCSDRQILAIQNNVPLSVQLLMADPPTKKCISVYEPNISVYSRLRRLIVSFNERKNIWYCPCSRTKRSCIHKHIGKWHLFQTDPNLFSNRKVQTPSKPRNKKVKRPKAEGVPNANAQSTQRADADVESDVEDAALETIETMEAIESIESMVAAMETDVSTITYPPKDIQMIRNMVQYLLINKRLPALLPDHLSLPVDKDYPRHLIPIETNCLYCADAIALSQPVLITHKAKILTYSKILQDISTYYKFCPRCGVPYRYQEWGDGLHNFNDNLLLDLPLCLMIRNTLQANTTFNQIVESLKTNKGAAFPSADTLLRGYLHFEALMDSQHQYSCVTYGNRPPVVVMELNNKGFYLSGRDLAEPTADLNGPGDMDHLWKALKEERIARGLVSSTKNPVLYKIM